VRFTALLFGAGDHRTPTEERPPPPRLAAGAALDLGPDLEAVIERVWPASARLVDLRFRAGAARLWAALYRHGRPIQYAYVPDPLALWDTQTRYAARPVCAEMPSAGRPLTWEVLLELGRRGVGVAALTHAAGISSTGDAALDALLPLPERYEIPAETVRAVRAARQGGGRVIAVGTTAARALEGAAARGGGELAAGAGVTDLVIRRETQLRVVDGLLTGMHGPKESHYRILEALAPRDLLRRAHAHAEAEGYLAHEFGDATLVLGG
jgi:S-adenosylmethionine:tRNA ribosyltransferase-isomerase